MTNGEFYGNKIVECFTSNKDICKEIIAPFVLEMFGRKCQKTNCSNCRSIYSLWLGKEYVEKNSAEDWEVDTKVYVSDLPFSEDNKGKPAYFKSFAKGTERPYITFSYGRTSFTTDNLDSWKYCRLAEEGES